MSLIYPSGDQSHDNLLDGEQNSVDKTEVEIPHDSSVQDVCTEAKCTDSIDDGILIDKNGLKEQEVHDSELGTISGESFSTTILPSVQYQRSATSAFFRSRDNPEISPFKEAKDFVLSKLSKKLGPAEGSHASADCDKRTLLSGLKEIIAKKLEDKIGKDSSHGVVPVPVKAEKGGHLAINYSVDGDSKVTIKDLDPVYKGSCELKSVVANDLESSIIEEAHECVEELNGTYSEPEDLTSAFFTLNMDDTVPPPSPPPRSKTISNIAAAAHSVLSPKKGKGKQLPVSYSALRKTNEFDANCLVEEEGDIEAEELVEQERQTDMPKRIDPVNLERSNHREIPSTSREYSSAPGEHSQTRNFSDIFSRFYPKQTSNLFHSPFKVHFVVLVIAYFVCQYWSLSTFSAGFVTGILLSSVLTHACVLLTRRSQPKDPLHFPDYKTLPPLNICVTVVEETSSYKGWMNEYQGYYNPDTFRISSTKSVYVCLEGSYLVLSYPKKNIPRRAMWNEREHDPSFLRHSHHFLNGAKVSIVPEGLAKIRVWNKKYPLCLTFPDLIKGTRSASLERRVRRASCELDDKKNLETQSLPNSLSGSPAHQSSSSEKSVVYLFARTDREKEEWYWRFVKACRGPEEKKSSSVLKLSDVSRTSSSMTDLAHSTSASVENVTSDQGSLTDQSLQEENEDSDSRLLDKNEGAKSSEKNEMSSRPVRKKPVLDFEQYMAMLIGGSSGTFGIEEFSLLSDERPLPVNPSSLEHWLNVFLGRMFFDFLTQEYWAKRVKNRIQKKLTRIKVPLMDEFQVTDIFLGTSLPQIGRASDPVMDSRGLWIDLDIEYSGSFQMTLETKLNLTGITRSQVDSAVTDSEADLTPTQKESTVKYEGSDDDSPESSDDEDLPEATDIQSGSGGHMYQPETSGAGQKIIGLLEKWLQSKRFQNMAENKFIKRAVTEVSNTPLVLTVELHGLFGTLALNIPPLPTDRLWIGFKTNPELSLSAYPRLGEREINYSQITEMIEKKLRIEFQKVMVMPNMEDIMIPMMHSTLYDHQKFKKILDGGTANHLSRSQYQANKHGKIQELYQTAFLGNTNSHQWYSSQIEHAAACLCSW